MKAETYIEMEGEPYLEKPARSETILHTVDWGGDEYQFPLGEPYQDPPQKIWCEYLQWNGYEYFEEFHCSDDPGDYGNIEVDYLVDEWTI